MVFHSCFAFNRQLCIRNSDDYGKMLHDVLSETKHSTSCFHNKHVFFSEILIFMQFEMHEKPHGKEVLVSSSPTLIWNIVIKTTRKNKYADIYIPNTQVSKKCISLLSCVYLDKERNRIKSSVPTILLISKQDTTWYGWSIIPQNVTTIIFIEPHNVTMSHEHWGEWNAFIREELFRSRHLQVETNK